MGTASPSTDRTAVATRRVLTTLLVIAAVLLGLALFFAGAAWRARVTSSRQSLAATSRVFSSHLPLTRSIASRLWPAATIRAGVSWPI